MQEIGGAVERVDDPDELVAAAAARLLAEEAVVRVDATHRLDDVPLGHVVDFGDEIVAALGLHADGRHPVEVAHDDVTRAAGGADGNIEHRRHVHAASRRWVVGKSGGNGPARSRLEYQSMSIRIVLVGTSHPGNIGSAARAMKTMGLESLYLVAPERFPAPEATALAAGADDVLAERARRAGRHARRSPTAASWLARRREVGTCRGASSSRAKRRWRWRRRRTVQRSRDPVRRRAHRPAQRRPAAVPHAAHDPDRLGLHVAEPRDGGAGRRLRGVPRAAGAAAR